MRKYAFLFLSILLSSNLCFAQIKYSITGVFPDIAENKGGVKNGDTIKLSYLGLDTSKKAVVKNGMFVFNESLREPTIAMLSYKYGGTKLLLDNSSYSIKIEIVEPRPHQYSYSSNIVTKSAFHNLWSNFYDDYGKLSRAKRLLLDTIDQTLDNSKVLKLKTKVQDIDAAIIRGFKLLAINNPGNNAVPYILPDAPDFSYQNYISIYNTLSDKVKTSFYGVKLLEKLNAIKSIPDNGVNNDIENKKDFIGQKLPLISAIDVKGNKSVVNSKFTESKFTLIDFWASWCSPCRTLNIELRSKKESLKSLGLTIIGFSLDNDLDNWKKAVSIDNVGWLQVSDLKAQNSSIVKYLSLYAIPANVLVNRNGVIVAKDLYGEQLEAFLKSHQ